MICGEREQEERGSQYQHCTQQQVQRTITRRRQCNSDRFHGRDTAVHRTHSETSGEPDDGRKSQSNSYYRREQVRFRPKQTRGTTLRTPDPKMGTQASRMGGAGLDSETWVSPGECLLL